MRFSDLMLLLGILTAVVTPVLEIRMWLLEGFEDDEGFHFGPFPRRI
jgi:hypothetical protein